MKPTVYWGGIEGHPVSLHDPLVPLYKDFTESTPKNETFKSCPAFMDYVKNTYILKSPTNLDFKSNGDVFMGSVQVGGKDPTISEIYTQFLDSRTFFWADRDVKMTVLPPFLHTTNVRTAVGCFNIAKWFRSVSYTQLISNCPTTVRAGEPLYYIQFDRDVKLEQITFPAALHNTVDTLMKTKFYSSKLSLRKRYDLFMANRMNKIILKQIKEYNDA